MCRAIVLPSTLCMRPLDHLPRPDQAGPRPLEHEMENTMETVYGIDIRTSSEGLREAISDS